ncbi:hypothetical protein CDAR_175211 [Caerostris darwini]|uniref:Uncharacterized protein n=1 Tax=Caerostris darwini TaxID=1538125 RepID=A0AAV4VZ21_9ARAC|nr:hypothetical protein CDAR_175211 [Caerostris darwini]
MNISGFVYSWCIYPPKRKRNILDENKCVFLSAQPEIHMQICIFEDPNNSHKVTLYGSETVVQDLFFPWVNMSPLANGRIEIASSSVTEKSQKVFLSFIENIKNIYIHDPLNAAE